VIAHIGNIPVEEWLPFLVPFICMYVYVRRKERRRRREMGRLPAPGEPLDEDTVEAVRAEWRRAEHGELSPAHLPLLYPPGPDGMSPTELAARVHSDLAPVERLLEELEDLEYLEVDEPPDPRDRRVWLTFRGHELVDATESALLVALERGGAASKQAQ
jgi:DNA-binding MarR family transcriptional regulator